MRQRPSKRTLLLISVSLLALAALWIARRLQVAGGPAGPASVVLISIDTCRADHLSCYGYRTETTPNIDRVAQDGVRFTRVHSTNPITLPAHSSMLTGTNPLFHGVHNNHSYRLGASNVTLAEILKEHGYVTAAFLSARVLDSRFGLDQGFDLYDDTAVVQDDTIDEQRGERTSQAAIRWLEAGPPAPFFLFLHYFDPHIPYAPPEPFASRHADSPYAGEIAYADHCIGEVIEKLKALGLYEDSVVLITSDHGESLGDHEELTHSFFVYDSVIRVPLVIRAPGGVRSVQCDQPAGIIDIVPTVLGLLNLPAPPAVRGVDLSPWVLGRGEPMSRELYGESLVPLEYGCSPLRALIRDDWKYIWTTRPELYDLALDPAEQEDRSAEKPELASTMQARLREMIRDQSRAEEPGSRLPLDPETLRRLRSLGYAGGTSAAPSSMAEPGGEDPKDFIDILNLLLRANDLRARGRFEEARRTCLEVLADRPDNLRALQILGDVSIMRGEFESAVAYYSRYLSAAGDTAGASPSGTALSRNADLAEVHYNLGNSLHRLRRFESAADHYRQAIRLWDEIAPARNSLGALLAEAGRLREAIDHFHRALEIDPTLKSAQDNLARAEELLNRRDQGQ